MTDNLLTHLRPATLAQLAAELIADHAEELKTDSYDFTTEAAKNAYSDILAAGLANCGDDFWALIETARAAELN